VEASTEPEDSELFAYVTENALVLSITLGAASLVLLGVSFFLVFRAGGGRETPLRRKTHEESLSAKAQ
jgi:hypothetical protein